MSSVKATAARIEAITKILEDHKALELISTYGTERGLLDILLLTNQSRLATSIVFACEINRFLALQPCDFLKKLYIHCYVGGCRWKTFLRLVHDHHEWQLNPSRHLPCIKIDNNLVLVVKPYDAIAHFNTFSKQKK